MTQLSKVYCLFLCLFIIGSLSGCGRLNDQVDAESQVASQVAMWMKLHDVNAAGTPITNLAQTFSNIRHSYPYKEHYDLKRYGRSAGFTNSLEEKYTFFWPRLIHELVEGEVICINAQPFPKRQDGPHRVYIARSGDNYITRLLPEEVVARVLHEAKPAVVPTGVAKPPPPPPPEVQEYIHPSLNQRYERFVWDLAGALGQDSTMGVRWLLRACAFLFVVVAGFVVLRAIRLRVK